MPFIVLILLTLNQALAGVSLTSLSYYEALKSIKTAPLVVLTVASSAKVHGHHLPMNTDVILAERLAKDLAQQTTAAIFPNVTVGWYPQFLNFKLVNHSAEVAQRVFRETLEGLISAGARRVLVINFDDEYSSGLPMMTAMSELKQRYPTPMLLISWYDFVNKPVADLISTPLGHADELETSLMLYLDETHVDKSKLRNAVFTDPSLKLNGFKPLILDPKTVPGQMGDSTQATAEKGQRAYAQILENIKKSIADLTQIPLPKN